MMANGSVLKMNLNRIPDLEEAKGFEGAPEWLPQTQNDWDQISRCDLQKKNDYFYH
jgi:hypothetical protein